MLIIIISWLLKKSIHLKTSYKLAFDHATKTDIQNNALFNSCNL